MKTWFLLSELGVSEFNHCTELTRAVFIFFVSLILSVSLSRPLIYFLKKLQMGQVVRSDGPQAHLSKKGTPTMGGVLILITVTLSLILFGNLKSVDLWLCLWVFWSVSLVGFWDDWKKLVLKNPKGLSARAKMFYLSFISLITGLIIIKLNMPIGFVLAKINWHWILNSHANLTLSFSILSGIGCLFLIWFVIVGSSNAVNLTDGLDGLVIVPVMLTALGLGWMAKHSGLPVDIEITMIASALLGSGLGFLWKNAYPAELFMGDVGALGLGALLAMMAILLNQIVIFGIMSGLFILEALSVMAQVGFYKLRKKRIFKMAPIHHHFELLGWFETKVTIRFWIVALIFLILGLWCFL